MTALTRQQPLLPVSDSRGSVPRNGAEQDQMTVAVAVWPVKLRQAENGLTSRTAATPGGPAGVVLAAPMASGPAPTPAGTAARDGHEAAGPAGPSPGMPVAPDLPPEDAARLRQLSAPGRGDVAVLGLRGEPDLPGASALQAYLSDIRRQARARCIVDLTGLAFIDCSCLSVLVRHCKMIRSQGGSFALAGPQPAVLRILAVTGLLTWFEVHDTVEEAVAGAGTRRSPRPPCGIRPAPAAIGAAPGERG
jgi:anti-sigma B factor antagonist